MQLAVGLAKLVRVKVALVKFPVGNLLATCHGDVSGAFSCSSPVMRPSRMR